MEQNARADVLQGVRVVDLSTFVAAPMCSRMLADLGADVIKVESPRGDPWRETAKANTGSDYAELPVYDIYNSRKRDVCLDLKHPDGMKAFLDLLATADIFVTNTRAPSLKKLGIDYESLKERFPRLIYATITGYGAKGPDAASPGFDNIAFWTRSGFMLDMSVKTENSYPTFTPTGGGDTVTGGFLMGGILAALYRREKTGKGDFVTASLYNAGIWTFAGSIIQAQKKYGVKFPKERSDCPPIGTFYRCADGEWFAITVLDHDRYRDTVFRLLGVWDEVEPFHITTQLEMKQMSAKVIPILERAFLKKTTTEWLEIFQKADIVCGIVNHMRDVSEDEQADVNGYVQDFTCRNGAVCRMPCMPVRFASQPEPSSLYASYNGEDTDSVLTEIGYSKEQIEKLKADGAAK